MSNKNNVDIINACKLLEMIERLRINVQQVLRSVINLHIDIMVLEANVTELITEVKEFNAELLEVKRLDTLIELLKNFNGPIICHEWPYPLLIETEIEEADIVQCAPTTTTTTTSANNNKMNCSKKTSNIDET